MTPSYVKTALTTGSVLGLAILIGLPGMASAQNRNQNRYDVSQYDGYCYAKQKDAKRDGALLGAVLGGALGGSVADTHNKGLGTVLGAVIGGTIGSNSGRSSVKCYNGEYYSYQGSYYQPASPPAGYTTVYYQNRPSQDQYSHVYYDRYHHETPPPYTYNNAWRNDRDNPNGYRDDNGSWHDNGRRTQGHR